MYQIFWLSWNQTVSSSEKRFLNVWKALRFMFRDLVRLQTIKTSSVFSRIPSSAARMAPAQHCPRRAGQGSYLIGADEAPQEVYSESSGVLKQGCERCCGFQGWPATPHQNKNTSRKHSSASPDSLGSYQRCRSSFPWLLANQGLPGEPS